MNKVLAHSRRMKYHVLRRFGHRDYKKFVIVARSRTGSNLLLTYLNSHPWVHGEGELFVRLNGRDHKDILAKIFGKQPRYAKAVGFKLFYYHPVDDDAKHIWDDIEQMKDVHIIHIKRRNVLRTLVSRKVAVNSNVWATSSDKSVIDDKTVTFTPEELEGEIAETKAWEQTADRRLKDHPMLPIYYEDLASNPNAVFRQVTDFLELPAQKPSTPLRRQNPEKLSTLIRNYDDLKAAFMGTKWHRYFEE